MENENIFLNVNSPVEQVLLSEIAVRLKMLVELNIEILSALSKRDLGEIGKEYDSKWQKYFQAKLDFMAKTQ